MHPRRAILDAIHVQLASASSPAHPIVEQDQTAGPAPCWQIAVSLERRGDASTRAGYERVLELAVTAWATSPSERDQMSEDLETALLGGGSAGTLELEWLSVSLGLPEERAGERLYPATYQLAGTYFSGR